jgi:hypothetical protein
MNSCKNPAWWCREKEIAWNRIRMLVKRNWDRTKHEVLGSGRDIPKKAGNRLQQTHFKKNLQSCPQPTFEEWEPAYRFGYGARLKFGGARLEWDADLEIRLAKDWRALDPKRKEKWEQDRNAIRYGWDYSDALEGNAGMVEREIGFENIPLNRLVLA